MEDNTSAPQETAPSTEPTEPAPERQPEAPVEQPASEPAPAPEAPHSNKKKLFIIIGAVAAFIIAGVVLAVLVSKSSKTDKQSDNHTTTTETTNAETPVPNAEATWASTIQEVAAPAFFTKAALTEYYGSEEMSSGTVKLHKLGTDGSKELFILELPPQGMGGSMLGVVVKDGSAYKLLQKNSPDFFGEEGDYYGPDMSQILTIDKTTVYAGLITPESFKYNGVTASSTSNGTWDLTEDLSNAVEVAKVPEGTVYEAVTVSDHHQGVKQFYVILKLPAGVYATYRVTPSVLKSDNTASVKWKDGTSSTETYQWSMVFAGCGHPESVNVLDKAYHKDLVEIGTINGQTAYGLNNASHPTIKTVYDNYGGADREGGVSQQQFFNDRGVVVVKNEIGYRVILVNNKYQQYGECAKPVIYLYPEAPTSISVKVGARVTKSEPAYNGGWNVLAMPNGSLITGNGVYESLFWDGIGDGTYPQINSGFVVKRADVEATLRDHLSRQGLNAKESEDFLEYWLPLMPEKPYVRLTWFTTREMNELAPLYLSKKPDTLIRVFLDFEGLDQPVNLPAQKLSHPPRTGFTVIEWGGLLISN